MLIACGMAGGSLVGWGPALAAIPLVAIRILAEERLLFEDQSYQTYAGVVRWRLVPGLW